KATLDAHGVLKLTYRADTTTESYLEAQNKIIEFNTPFVCNQVSSYTEEWGTPALRLINADGTVNKSISISDVIMNVECDSDLSEPGTYKIVYTYKLPDTGVSKELTRGLVVSPDMDDIVSLTATVTPAKVIINNSVSFVVKATNRIGETKTLNAGDYTISTTATNVAGKFNPTITYNKENSDNTKPTTTTSYEVMDNVSSIISGDANCKNQSDNSCWYIGNQTGNYLSYSGKLWRIFKKDSSNNISIILNDVTGVTYAFTDLVDSYNCRPTACCNSSQSLSGRTSSYLLTQNPNGLNTYLTSTFLNSLTNHSTYLNNTTFDISGYGSSSSASITQKVGLLSYAEYNKISNCSTFTCGASYLKTNSNWGLGTFYRTNVQYSSTYNLAAGSYNRYVAPRYNESLYVNSSGNILQAAGSFTLKVSTSGRTITSNQGTKLGVKPVVVLKSGTKITGGTGTASNPYRVG
ncbi:MAG: hypothetical protein PHF21_01355, partial [Bacilli bacterium]|nr:hypothetical protein [Bacilli bacterium]